MAHIEVVLSFIAWIAWSKHFFASQLIIGGGLASMESFVPSMHSGTGLVFEVQNTADW